MTALTEAPPLPVLRPDLALLQGAPGRQGEPRWLIHDALQQRFIQLEDTAHRLLTLWPLCRTAGELASAMERHFGIEVDAREIEAFVAFLHTNHLTAGDDWRRLHALSQQHRSLIWRALHGYLFVRIPLLRPNAFLQHSFPAVSFLFTRTAFAILMLVGAGGLYLASRQWEAFVTTFSYLFTVEGFLAFAATLVLVKIAHELGHAYMAVRFGCAIPTMGIAFVVLTPMPYTDVTDAWRLQDRRQRLLIDSAGMLVELGIAAIATLLWSFLPDGPLRSMAFMLATVGWLMSLAVNLNPFMRFDGYYLASDIVGIENLQPRAFALGRWRLRELLFGLGLPSPERLPAGTQALLIVYAWMTWVYRLVLFLGIALFVYHYFFKALGIALFLVEIIYFIAFPIASELAAWYRMRRPILTSRRSWITGALLALALCAVLVPWSRTIRVPALLEAAETAQLHAPRPALVTRVSVAQGEEVVAGQELISLRSPALEQALTDARIRLQLNSLRMARRAGDELDREETTVLDNERRALLGRIEGLAREAAQLTIAAPIAGRVLEIGTGLHPGRWVNPREQLALVGRPDRLSARGYVAEKDLWRVQPDAPATFIPEMPTRAAVSLQLDDVSLAGVTALDLAELASTHGGRVAATEDQQRRLVPKSGEFLAVFAAAPDETDPAPERAIRGLIHLRGEAESIAAGAWRQVLKVLVRESGA
ncbi:HlyD family efflux transporter periplasmic adaptor subunit [Bosea beijingensis]|uniref:HlyD family efflux transporter periplasmic adaptor subunit n=1 Tax=Bosea beijingensis TaxID=3068632 RepID=UPI002740BE81|nr:HlyD family efflux transporter periplasmic adaptor subunit [Bosea sp. REN20]